MIRTCKNCDYLSVMGGRIFCKFHKQNITEEHKRCDMYFNKERNHTLKELNAILIRQGLKGVI